MVPANSGSANTQMLLEYMTEPFTDAELEHLLSFIGYGNLSAPVWFLGMEEGGGGEEDLRWRLTFDRIEDLYEANKKLGNFKYHEGRRVIQRTWRAMCVIMLELKGKKATREEIRRYQAEELGRRGKDTFLLELMPIPKPNMGAWGYEHLLPQFDSREDYYDQILPERVRYLRRLIDEHTPAVVIGYGRAYWRYYRRLFPAAEFTDEGPFQIAEGEPFVLLSHHFTARSMNGRFTEIVAKTRTAYANASE